jgi:hypothetical protein
VVAAAGTTLIEPRPDFSHTALTWERRLRALVGERLPGGWRAALQLEELRVGVLAPDGRWVESLPLAGQTLSEALKWLGEAIARARQEPPRGLLRPVHELPPHPVRADAPFGEESPAALRALAHWFANGDFLLREVAEGPGFAPVRCWPHHFDIGTLESLGSGAADPEHVRSVGLGLSPGDASYPEPYWYVNPWPRPEGRALPQLPEGHWHTDGWFGAVLAGSQLAGLPPKAQQLRTQAFLVAALRASRELLA